MNTRFIFVSVLSLSLVLGMVLTAPTSAAQPALTTCGYASISGPLVDFEGLTAQNYDTVLTSQGVQFGERFMGQTLTIDSSIAPFEFDVLSGTPSAPLTVQVGLVDQNISVAPIVMGQGLIGLSPLAALPPPDANIVHGVGEGSVAMLFPAPASRVGFRLGGGHAVPQNMIFLDFFRTDGSSIVSFSLTASNAVFGFCRDADIEDIAGVSIYNIDLGGVTFDDVVFQSTAAAPLPLLSPLAIALLGTLLGAAVIRRLRR